MKTRENAIINASKVLKGMKTVSTFHDPLRLLPEGKKKHVKSIRS